MKIRAKMRVNSVLSTDYSDEVKLAAVCGGSQAQMAEDNSYARATPSGELRLVIDNPALKGAMKPGSTWYIDMEPVPVPTPAS